MLNPFPIMFLSMLAHAILRLFVGGVFLALAYRHVREREAVKKNLAKTWRGLAGFATAKLVVLELVIGLMFVAGFYTQIAALLTLLFCALMLVHRRSLPFPLSPQPMVLALLTGAALSLFITGAGVFAFDLPI